MLITLSIVHVVWEQAFLFPSDKYSSFMEEERAITPPEHCFRLPFEFSEDDRLGPWDILISEDAFKFMSRLKSPLAVKAIMKKLGKISSGAWDKHKLNNKVPSFAIPVYETELHDHDSIKILWQVDSGFSVRSYQLTQIVKIWVITSSQDQIDETLKILRLAHQVYKAEQSRRCATRLTGKNDIILPELFGEEMTTTSTENEFHDSRMDDERFLEVHKMLVTNKFIPLSKNLFKSLVMGGTGFTFQVSKLEHEIINHPTSAIIIGRSGTGKTTCIVFRLLASYINNSRKRQIFITASHHLCHRVKEYFHKLKESAVLVETKMSLAQFHEFVRKKEQEGHNANLKNDEMEEEGDEDKDLSEIHSFYQLTEDHFPLFITYKKFSEMLEGTYEIDARKYMKMFMQQSKREDDDVVVDDKEEKLRRKFSLFNTTWAHFVNHDVFEKRYWRLFGDKKMDCELVYSEFSIIKGLNPEGKHLSREEYKAVSPKKYPAFCQNRDKIYDMFLRYEKLKKRKYTGDYDSMDRTLYILRRTTENELESSHIHEIYMDECQDNQIVDLGLILKIFNRIDSIFFAGDIAQCIAKGSSFRFQNLSALMYEWERTRAQAYNIPRGTIKPKKFELNVNYRAHSGILRLASSVIDLISDFFPESIDRLSREHSDVGGPRPVIVKEFKAETYFNIFSVGENTENNNIEFGAEQVIIVRDEKSKSRVEDLIGDAGIVLTVYEAKGMEFNDVLLYNFFTNSPGRQKWQLILSKSKEVQEFSYEKYYILSSELKNLYVAITRARQHIWIFDELSEYIEPICNYWRNRDLVKVVESKDTFSTLLDEFPMLLKKSNSAEWNQTGKKFFEERFYKEAMTCFKKSGNHKNFKLAKAYYFQQIARSSIYDSDEDTIISKFCSAAEAFQECSRPIQAASCYENINMYEKAAEVYVEWNMFDEAAYCFLKIPNFEKAGKYFEKINKYTEAVYTYNDGQCYEKFVNLMLRVNIDKNEFKDIIHRVNIHYRKVKDRNMSAKALSIFPTLEEKIDFLQKHAHEEFLEFCEKNGLFCVAAKDLRSRGRFNEATDMFPRMVGMFPCLLTKDDEIKEYLRCCLDLCRIKLVSPNFFQLKEHLSKAINIISKVKSQAWKESGEYRSLKEEFQLYKTYWDSDLDGIRKFLQLFRRREDRVMEFRAIIIRLYILKFDIQTENWRERLQCLLRLCELAFLFIAPRESENITKIYKDFHYIFLVNEVANHPYKRKISSDNHILHILNLNNQKNVSNSDGWHIYDEKALNSAISQSLATYIYKSILEAGQKGKEIRDISSEICFEFSSCSKSGCRNHHVIPTPSILHKRFSLACLQYTVMQQLNILYHNRLLKKGQIEKVRESQIWWAEILVKIHIRYQSPQTSCSEVTYAVLAELPKDTRDGLLYIARNIWLPRVFYDPNDFSVMLKCVLVLHQLQDKWGICEFDFEMSKKRMHKPSMEISTGINYYSRYQSILIGKQLSLFFSNLYNNQVLDAIMHIKMVIQYVINNIELISIKTSDAFGDLISFIEFKTSLVFAVGPESCDFCLPRAYLVNYFDAFTAVPLIHRQHGYNKVDYFDEITNSIDQVQQLFDLLISTGQVYLNIILRLIRLLVLICLNESDFATRVFDLFKCWSKKSFSPKVTKYLNGSSISRLAFVLHDDLKETDCDSLVIVHYHLGDSSKFSNLEEHGIIKLNYTSVERFHSALRQITAPIVIEERNPSSKQQKSALTPIASVKEDSQNNEKFELFKVAQGLAYSPQEKEAATKIQAWFRSARQQQKSRPHKDDPILEKIYNEMVVFCKNELYWKFIVERKKKMYHIILRGIIVKNLVDLTKVQGKMDATKIKLQKIINNRNSDDQKIDECLELLDDLKYIHYENIKMALDSLSIENTTKHQEVDIEWLKNESQMAENCLNEVYHWIDKCKEFMKK
ncbi:2253_t:CDS:10 [Ambispora leptoticha]|uniref:2253_t:CDS:1 n=1 Tax=Ambispora leptoticha TaxID=144679 RepID=A0A9N9AJX9_9GLOM|nr:2253_t:CDS:10 [Ambispora leptoticha]